MKKRRAPGGTTMNEQNRIRLIETVPAAIRHALGSAELVERRLGRSGNRVLAVGSDRYLKISADLAALRRERDTELWLEGRLIAPRVVEYAEDGQGRGYLVTTAVPGTPACSRSWIDRPASLCGLLAEAMAMVHSLPAEACPFLAEQTEARRALGRPENGFCFVHGDFCLPNVLLRRGAVSGFVDVAGAGVGDPWVDRAWCLWSLAYNTRSEEWNPLLLEKLGVQMDETKYREFVDL
jgi:aminoglycoside phosphotransferase